MIAARACSSNDLITKITQGVARPSDRPGPKYNAQTHNAFIGVHLRPIPFFGRPGIASRFHKCCSVLGHQRREPEDTSTGNLRSS